MAGIEHFQINQCLVPSVLDIVEPSHRHIAYVPRLVVKGTGLGAGHKDSHASLAPHIILELIVVGVPMDLSRMAPSSISTIAIVTVSQAGQSRVLHPYILQPLCRRGAGALPAQVITRPCRGAGVLRRKGRQHGQPGPVLRRLYQDGEAGAGPLAQKGHKLRRDFP